MVRLYIGGLAPDITADALQQRFVPFGAVQDCEVRPPKPEDIQCSPGSSCRGFGYVELEVKDDAALRRCLSQYNGCKWRGRVLRVEPAKISYLKTRKREREEDELAELEDSIPQKAAANKDAHVLPFSNEKPLQLVQPDGKPIATKPGKRKTHFPLTRTVPQEQLSWGDLPTPPGAQRRAAAEALACAEAERRALVASHITSQAQEEDPLGADIAGGGAEDGNIAAGVPTEKDDFGPKPASRKRGDRTMGTKPKGIKREHSLSPARSDSSDSLEAVDFASAEETLVQRHTTDLSRFEESDDEGPPPLSKSVKPALKRRRGVSPGKADRASARKADVAAVVDRILAATAKKEAKSLKTSMPTEKSIASLRIPAAQQDQRLSSVVEANQSSTTTSSSSAEPPSGKDAQLASATRIAAGPSDDPEAEALWAAQGGIDSYLAALLSEDDGPPSRAGASPSTSASSEIAASEQLARSSSHDEEAGSEQKEGSSSHEDEADSEQQAGNSEDPAEKDPGALWEAQGGLERYLAALDRDTDAEPDAVDRPVEERRDDENISEQEQSSSSDDAHEATAVDSSHDAGSNPSAQGGALNADRVGDGALSSPAPDSLVDDEGYQDDNPEQDAAGRDDNLQGEGDEDEEILGEDADQQILLAADAAIEADALQIEEASDIMKDDLERESSGEEGSQAVEGAVMDNAFEGLDAGANFWAGGVGAEKLEAEWQATREQLASSWKAKRRDALRHTQGGAAKKKRRR